ncbi:MAG: ABC transporter substrate-binding protein [Oscillospiraceae bacterium]|nr:ABC transporter substrate-binding protein [Oscillospiraceae bacterium]
MKRIIAILLAVSLFLALVACGTSNSSTTTDTTNSETSDTETAETKVTGTTTEDGKHVLRVGTTDTACSFYPTASGGIQRHMVYESIYKMGENGSEPWLIESFEWIDDTTAEMVVRDDVYFSNGEQMLAEDVVYSMYFFATDSQSMWSDTYNKIDFDATTISEDGWTITLKLKEVYAPFESTLFLCYVMDKSVVENMSSDDASWWNGAVATGPYEVVENVDGSHITLSLREDYWDTENMPDWDEITIYFYTESTAMFIAFENSELDLVLNVSNEDAERLMSGDVSNAENIAYDVVHSNSAYLLCMSPYKEEFQDEKVREAIAHVINGTDVGNVQFGVLYDADLDSTIPSSVNYYTSVGTYETDVEYAQQCMAESNYPDGFDVNVVTATTDSNMWTVIQAELEQINIHVTITYYDLTTCIPLWMQEGGTDMQTLTVSGGNTSLDPYEAYDNINAYGSMAACHILDDEYNAIYNRTLTTTDETERAEAYAELQQWLYDNYQAIPVCEPLYCYAYNTEVMTTDGLSSVTKAYVHFACKAVD